MEIMQKAYETYVNMESIVGLVRENHTVLPPIYHNITEAGLEVQIDVEGNYISASRIPKDSPKIAIPVTEESLNRSSGSSWEKPHPLCDKLKYFTSYNKDYLAIFVQKLEKWCNFEYSHSIIEAVLKYLKKGKLLVDLSNSKIVELDKTGRLKHDDEESILRWKVIGIDDGECWKNRKLFECWINYYKTLESSKTRSLCLITGEETICADKHMGVSGKAK